jgi:hypothetical protein
MPPPDDSLAGRIFSGYGFHRPWKAFLGDGSTRGDYILLFPVLPVGALVYNFFVYPKKYKTWQGMFMCQRCGASIDP